MEWSMCVEMLFRNSGATTLGLVVRWLCQRDRDRAAPPGAAGDADADDAAQAGGAKDEV